MIPLSESLISSLQSIFVFVILQLFLKKQKTKQTKQYPSSVCRCDLLMGKRKYSNPLFDFKRSPFTLLLSSPATTK